MPSERISILTALLTPFDDRGEVDHEALRAHVEVLIGEGVDAVRDDRRGATPGRG